MADRHKINGHALRAMRIAAGLSQATLAVKAGLDHSYVSRLENGARKGVNGQAIDGLAAALGVPVDALTAFSAPIEPQAAPAPNDLSGELQALERQMERAKTETARWQEAAREADCSAREWQRRAVEAERALQEVHSVLARVGGFCG